MKHVSQNKGEEEKGNSNHSFVFGVSDCDVIGCISNNNGAISNAILVDCGATAHILNDSSNFISFQDDFNPDEHFLEKSRSKLSFP